MTTDIQDSSNGRWIRALTELYLFVLVLAILPFTAQAAIDIKRLITVWAVFALAAACLAAILRKKLSANSPNLLGGILAAYLAYTLFTALYSPHRGYAFTQWTTAAVHAVLYVVVAQCYRNASQVRRLMLVICVAVALSSIYGFFQYAGLDPFPWAERASQEYRQMPSTFGNPNYAGHTLILALIMVAALAWTKGSRRYLVLGAPLAIHFIMTGMRSGRVALAAAALLVALAWLASRYVKSHTRAVPLALAGTALTGALCVALLLGAHRIHSGRYLPLDPSLLLRYNSYYGASRMILTHPLSGVGPGGYVIENPPYWTGYEQLWFATESKANDHVHNDLLEEAVNSGLPAAGLYLAFLLSAIAQSLSMALTTLDSRRRPMAFGLAAFFTAFMIDGLFGFNVRVPVSAPLLFVMAGALEGLRAEPGVNRGTVSRGMKALYVPMIGIALLAVFLGTSEFVSQYNTYYGKVYADHKEYTKALSYFTAAHAWAPSKWEPSCAMGQSAHAANQNDTAIACLTQSLERNPNYLPALDALARTYADRAARDATSAQASSTQGAPPSPEADLREAAANADRVLTLCPDLPETLECRGRISSLQAVVAMRSGKTVKESTEYWKLAKKYLESSAKLETRNRGRVQRMLAEACIALNDVDGAENAFAQSIDAAPDSETLHSFYSYSVKVNRYPAFLNAVNATIAKQLQKRVKNPAAASQLYLALADAYQQMGGQRDAEENALRNALLQAPDRYDLWERYARFHNADLAPLKDIRDIVNRAPDAARKIPAPIDSALQASPSSPQNLSNAVALTGQAYLAASKRAAPETLKQEFRWLAKLLESQIDSPSEVAGDKGKALRGLGALYAALGETKSADRVLTLARAALTGSDRADCALEHASLLSQLGRRQEALAAAESAQRDAPNDPRAILYIAQCNAALGHVDVARGLYETLRRMPHVDPAILSQMDQDLQKLK